MVTTPVLTVQVPRVQHTGLSHARDKRFRPSVVINAIHWHANPCSLAGETKLAVRQFCFRAHWYFEWSRSNDLNQPNSFRKLDRASYRQGHPKEKSLFGRKALFDRQGSALQPTFRHSCYNTRVGDGFTPPGQLRIATSGGWELKLNQKTQENAKLDRGCVETFDKLLSKLGLSRLSGLQDSYIGNQNTIVIIINLSCDTERSEPNKQEQ